MNVLILGTANSFLSVISTGGRHVQPVHKVAIFFWNFRGDIAYK